MSFVTSADGAMRAIFDKIDTDGNGTLDRDEVAACMKLLRPSRFMDIQLAEMDGRDEIAEVMAQMDDDGDGTVTFEEFSAWWKAGGSVTASEQVAEGAERCGDALAGALEALAESRAARSQALASEEADRISEQVKAIAAAAAASA